MAQPTGSYEAGSYYLPLTATNGNTPTFLEATPCFLYFIFRLPLLPPWLTDSGVTPETEVFSAHSHLPQRIQVGQRIYLAGAGDLIYVDGYTATPSVKSWRSEHTGTLSDWADDEEDTSYQTQCLVWDKIDGEDKPLIGVCELKIFSPDEDYNTNASAALDAVEVKTVVDVSETEKVEWLSRIDNKTYENDYPASSYLVADALLGGYLHAIADNYTSFCIPVGGRFYLEAV